MGTGDKVIWIIVVVFMLGAPISIIRSWYFAASRILPTKQSWRDRMNNVALAVITIAAALWLPYMAYLPSQYVTSSGLDWYVYEVLGRSLRPVTLAIV